MFGLMDQFRHPNGRRGRLVAALMNMDHRPLTIWGLRHVEIEPDYVILDVGCGGGKTVSRLAKKTPHGKVFGIDYSTEMVEYSKKVNKKLIAEKRVEILEGSVDKMVFSDDFFDLVTAIETYYFWSIFSDGLKEIQRVLKPRAKLLMVNEMVKDGSYDVKSARTIEQAHVRLIPLDEIRNTALRVGFVNVQVFTKEGSPWNAVLAKKPEIEKR
jgi:ubiquinone/menaquinone biosynthesis C-methylase UbiE